MYLVLFSSVSEQVSTDIQRGLHTTDQMYKSTIKAYPTEVTLDDLLSAGVVDLLLGGVGGKHPVEHVGPPLFHNTTTSHHTVNVERDCRTVWSEKHSVTKTMVKTLDRETKTMTVYYFSLDCESKAYTTY